MSAEWTDEFLAGQADDLSSNRKEGREVVSNRLQAHQHNRRGRPVTCIPGPMGRLLRLLHPGRQSTIEQRLHVLAAADTAAPDPDWADQLEQRLIDVARLDKRLEDEGEWT